MKFIKSLTILLVANIIPAWAIVTAQQERNPSTRKVVEFSDLNYETTISYLDLFSIELRKEANAKGYVVVYRSDHDLPGVNLRYALRAKNYLVKTRGHNLSQIVPIDGGVKACLTTELWVVPENAAPPNSMVDKYQYELVNQNFLRKFDEHRFYLPQDPSDCGWCGYEDKASHLDAFAEALKKEPQSQGYVIAYAQYYEDQGMQNYLGRTLEKSERYVLYDPVGTTQKMLQAEKNYLLGIHKIARTRIVTINGGYRTHRTVELWVAPPSVPPPNPVPTIYPKKRNK